MNKCAHFLHALSITLRFNRTANSSRSMLFYGDHTYSYGRISHAAAPINNPYIFELKCLIESFTNLKFNSVLINYYESGRDHIPWHSDNEKCIDPNQPQIASLSLGCTREFLMKPILDNVRPVSFHISSGSLLIMGHNVQSYFLHSIPQDHSIKSARINLTFRQLM